MSTEGKTTVIVTLEGNESFIARIVSLLAALDAYTPSAKGLYIGTSINPGDYVYGGIDVMDDNINERMFTPANETPYPFTGTLVIASDNRYILYEGDKNVSHRIQAGT